MYIHVISKINMKTKVLWQYNDISAVNSDSLFSAMLSGIGLYLRLFCSALVMFCQYFPCSALKHPYTQINFTISVLHETCTHYFTVPAWNLHKPFSFSKSLLPTQTAANLHVSLQSESCLHGVLSMNPPLQSPLHGVLSMNPPLQSRLHGVLSMKHVMED